VALAGEQVGGAQRIFSLTMEYLKMRHQFGQPIGKFQALKHMAADLLIELESSTSVARHAARLGADGGQSARLMSYLAAFTCADNYRKIAADAIQLYGGIAYTVEHPAHLYWRRAQSGQWTYCSSDRLRDLYLAEMEKML
jgi:alkylation response protein AidB-like acyl-CoA dehydrogenase